jgi:hypothetical protein
VLIKSWAIALFAANLVGIGILSILLHGISSSLISGVMMALTLYGVGLVAIPSIRYFWIQDRDRQVKKRNHFRHQQAKALRQSDTVREKLDYAKQFAKQHKITDRDIIYTTQEDALSQEFKRLE